MIKCDEESILIILSFLFRSFRVSWINEWKMEWEGNEAIHRCWFVTQVAKASKARRRRSDQLQFEITQYADDR